MDVELNRRLSPPCC